MWPGPADFAWTCEEMDDITIESGSDSLTVTVPACTVALVDELEKIDELVTIEYRVEYDEGADAFISFNNSTM
jgi:hypothetical protein